MLVNLTQATQQGGLMETFRVSSSRSIEAVWVGTLPSYNPAPCDNNCRASLPLQHVIVLWFRQTAPCLATSAWQRLFSGGNCCPGLPNTVYTRWSILRRARPPSPVSIHRGFHHVYSVYTGVSLNQTFMNAGSPENLWTRLDFGPQRRSLLAFWTILTQARLIKRKYLRYHEVLCWAQKPNIQSGLNIVIQHRFVRAIKTFSEKQCLASVYTCLCSIYVMYVCWVAPCMK